MKITVEITDPLLRETRKLAAREGTTLRALLEHGLYRVLAEDKPKAPFRLRRASFKGQGLQADFGDISWDKLRDAVYPSGGA